MMVAITVAEFAVYLTWRRYSTWRHTVTAENRWWATVRRQPTRVRYSVARSLRDITRLKATVAPPPGRRPRPPVPVRARQPAHMIVAPYAGPGGMSEGLTPHTGERLMTRCDTCGHSIPLLDAHTPHRAGCHHHNCTCDRVVCPGCCPCTQENPE